MSCVYRAGNKYDNSRAKLAREWAEQNDWTIICQKWVDLFAELDTQAPEIVPEEEIKGMLL
jgi:hypothetical protein